MFKKSSDVMRLHAEPAGDGWRERFGDGLAKHAFSDVGPKAELLDGRDGFVRIGDIGSSDFSDSTSYAAEPFVFFAFRLDKVALPKALFDAELRKRCTAWAAEREVERVPNAVRQEIRASLREEWGSRAIPRTKVVEIVVDPRKGTVLAFGSMSETYLDLLRRRFFQAFGLKLVPVSSEPALGLGDEVARRLSDATPIPIRSASGARLGRSGRPTASSELLDELYLWLWMRAEESGTLEVGVRRLTVWLEDVVRLSQEGTLTASFHGGTGGSDAREAVRIGKMPISMAITIRDEDDVEWGFVLGADYYRPRIVFPNLEPEDGSVEAAVFCRAHATIEAIGLLDSILVEYLGLRSRDEEGLVDQFLAFVWGDASEVSGEDPEAPEVDLDRDLGDDLLVAEG